MKTPIELKEMAEKAAEFLGVDKVTIKPDHWEGYWFPVKESTLFQQQNTASLGKNAN